MADNQLQRKSELKDFFDSAAVKAKFQEILGSPNRAAAFLTGLLQVANGNDKLQACSPVSIFNAAATAATLDLPINPNLGFAWIVPYNGQAQFQIGYKGFYQLAMRSGQYTRINAIPVYPNQFESWNELTEDLKADFSKMGEGEPIGYVAYFQNRNGFEKKVYWSKEKVWNHARKYSKNFNGPGSLWKTDFDSMALKTVIKTLISKWGIMSIQMEKAIQVDQAVIHNAEGTDISYPDNEPDSNADKALFASDATLGAIKGLTNNATERQ